jgi:hypothetical protein
LRAGGLWSDKIKAGTYKATDIPDLRAMLGEVEASLSAVSPTALVAHLERLFVHYPQPALNDSQLESRWQDWLDDLGALPADIVEAGCRDWRRSTANYAPTPGQFLDQVGGYMSCRVFTERALKTLIERLENV